MLLILTATLVFKLTLTKVLVTLTAMLVINVCLYTDSTVLILTTVLVILKVMPFPVNSPDCHYTCNTTCHILIAVLVTQANFFNRCPGHCQMSRDVPVAAT